MVIKVSTSISNFREKLLARTGLKEYRIHDIFRPCIFFGLYHWVDYFYFILHRGKKKVFFCGSDILLINWIKRVVLQCITAKHYCENEVEYKALKKIGIESEIRPMIFDDPNKFKACFKPSGKFKPEVYMTCHDGRQKEYGVDKFKKIMELFPNLDYNIYYNAPEAYFDEEIKRQYAAIRLNKFDGFAETLAKSVLMGQYPISWIPYPHITHVYDAKSLRKALEGLSKKKKPNYEARRFWLKKLDESLCNILL